MFVKFNQKALLEAVKRAGAITPTATMMDVLGCLRITADKAHGVTVEATNLLQSIRLRIDEKDAELIDEGVAVINAKRLQTTVAGLAGDAVQLRVNGDGAVLTSGRKRATLAVMQQDLWPSMPTPGTVGHRVARSLHVSEALGLVAHSVSNDPSRPHMNGALLELREGGIMRAASTDGHRLSFSEVADGWTVEEGEFPTNTEIIVPGEALRTIAAMTRGRWARVFISSDEGSIGVQPLDGPDDARDIHAGDWYYTKAIAGSFPPYENIIPVPALIPDDKLAKVSAHRESLIDANRFTASAKDKTTAAQFATGEGDTMRVSAKTDGIEVTDDIPVKYQGGARPKVGINPSYVQDALAGLRTEYVALYIQDGLKPVLILEHFDAADASPAVRLTQVVMPMRL